ncbi:MAG: GSCFA domain-containing protein [Microscillaceae bacterium]|nr:GSCFA domain-containing protein [Microscillaceae bacterium]MDW8459657.1 GSCFA domain-containing protein [Cytophagales bacterium]
MLFRTEILTPKSIQNIHYKHKILSIGSCFAQNMGDKLKQAGLEVLINPFGTVFNPISLHNLLLPNTFESENIEQGIVYYEEVFYHEDFHSEIKAKSQEELKNLIKKQQDITQNYLKNADWLLLTWGTAWVYVRKEKNKIVANCHKLPQKLFEKYLLSVEEISQNFQKLYQFLQNINPKLQIILTISPVRHLKDTLVLNNVSKATLLLAKHWIVERYEKVSYFPSYEIMLDDLRDYRFYASDLLHPNEQALQYIWEKFSATYFDSLTQQYCIDFEQISKAKAHKPFNPDTNSYQLFLEYLKKAEQDFEQKYGKRFNQF